MCNLLVVPLSVCKASIWIFIFQHTDPKDYSFTFVCIYTVVEKKKGGGDQLGSSWVSGGGHPKTFTESALSWQRAYSHFLVCLSVCPVCLHYVHLCCSSVSEMRFTTLAF